MKLYRRIARTIAVVTALTLGATLAAAQTITPDASPGFGSVTLSPALTLDPFVTTLMSGGSIEAGTIDPACRGFVSAAPDFRVTWERAAPSLRIYFASEGDATMVVRGPDGTIRCNDDGFGLNPLVEIVNPAVGDYNIWVGSYSSGDFLPGYLMISERPGTVSSPIQSNLLAEAIGVQAASEPQVQAAVSLDHNAPASFGTTTLEPGFAPDPFTTALVSGGSVNVAMLGLGSGCIGYAATAPDYSINLSGNMTQLHIGFTSDEGDTTLIVRLPTGEFACNDDTHGFNPEVRLSNVPAGQVDIWVGSYGSDTLFNGTLTVSQPVGGAPPVSSALPTATPVTSGMTSVTGATSTPVAPPNK